MLTELLETADVALPKHVVFGESSARNLMKSGWNQDESAEGRHHVWSQGRQSVLQVPLPGKSDVRMDFSAGPDCTLPVFTSNCEPCHGQVTTPQASTPSRKSQGNPNRKSSAGQ